MAQDIDFVWRDWKVPGNPGSGEYEPEKPRIRALLKQIQGGSGQAVTKSTLAALNGVTPPNENYLGIVLTGDGAGYYYRSGAAWVFGRGFSDTFAEMSLSGTGTSQTGTVAPGVDPSQVQVFWAEVVVENTGPLFLDGKPVRSVADNPLVAGEWTGTVLFVDRGDHWRLLVDTNAAAIASQAASDAVAAALAAQAAMTGAVLADNRFTSKAAVEAWHPVGAPDYVMTAGFAVPGDGGAARYNKVLSEPSHPGKLMITLDDGVTEVWYEIARDRRLRPEMFGEIGVDAAGDTAAWVALMQTCNAFGKARITANGEYLIDGSDVLFDIANGVEWAYLDLTSAVFRQQAAYSKTISFKELKRVTVRGKAEFYGLGGDAAAAELNMASGSNNGVAGIYTLTCDYVFIEDFEGYDHGGCALLLHDTRKKRSVKRATIIGIGVPYVEAVDNGGYFGIGGWTTSPTIQAGLGWQCEDVFEGNEIHGHSFGIQSVAVRTLRAKDNIISCLGQHCFYTIECRNWHVTGNNLSGAPQCAFKASVENYAGKFVGSDWTTGVAYQVGDLVRQNYISYVCLSAHTAGTFSTDLAANKWKLSSWNYHRAGNFSGNIINGCTEGLQIVQQGNPNGAPGKDNYYYDLVAMGNSISNGTGNAFYLNAVRNATIQANPITDMGYGIYGLNFDGTIAFNPMTRTTHSAIAIGLVGPTQIVGNRYTDCGLGGSGSTRTPVRIWTGQDLPSRDTAPRLYDVGNIYVFTGGGDAAGDHLFYCDDANVVLTMVGSMGTPSTKTFRHSGTLAYHSRNHVTTWHNSAMGPKDYTIGTHTTQRTMDPGADDLATLRQIVATLANDLMDLKDIR